MDDRRKPLLNYQEIRTQKILGSVAAENNAHVYAKVRVADVLNIQDSGLTSDEYGYALRAHFDFAVTDNNHLPLFAVEFDGPHHEYEKKTIARDKKKNKICRNFMFPLLRITAEFIDRKIRRFTILSWLAEIWFLEEALYEAQEDGYIPYDEPFNHGSFLADSKDIEAGRISFPYDLSYPSRKYIFKAYEKGFCKQLTPSILSAEGVYNSKYWTSLALVRLESSKVVIGKAHCRLFSFASVSAFSLSGDLATIDVAQRLKKILQGEDNPITVEQANLQIKKFEDKATLLGKSVLQIGASW